VSDLVSDLVVQEGGDGLGRDEILRGQLAIWQPIDGYRFSVDPLLLVDFVRGSTAAPNRGSLCDLGAGSEVIGLALAKAAPDLRVTAVELQPRLCAAAKKSVEENRLGEQVRVVELDLADEARHDELPGAEFQWAVSNPPYRPLGEGDANPDDESAIARHEVRLTLEQLCLEARRLLRPGGRAALVYPAERLVSLLSTLEEAGLRPLRLRFCHPRAGEPAKLALVEAQKGARSLLRVEPPLILLDEAGAYTAEALRALGG
jgi:tRNA1Val (adenine37-N6)-methyltransferase